MTLNAKAGESLAQNRALLKIDNLELVRADALSYLKICNKKFDVIFCRNVLIYFDKETTDKVLDLLVSNLDVKGHLIIGHSESGVIKHPCLKSLGNSIFQKVRN